MQPDFSEAPSELLPSLNVSRETSQALEHYQALLLKWTRKINLISRASEADLWSRHILDSAQLFTFLEPGPRIWLDLGSGAGLPGIVIATLSKGAKFDCQFHLVESDLRKSVFLQTAIRELDLPATVHAERIEQIAPIEADVISARALAPLSRLLNLTARFCGPQTRLVFPKGANLDSELTEAAAHWHIDADQVPSITDPDARILHIRQFREKP